jgi:hypothetical protein
MQRVLSILGVGAALVMLGVSGAMNYLFLSSLGKTPLEGHVLGGASAAADLLKCLLPFFIASAWRDRRMVASGAGVLVFIFFSAFSLLSAVGFAAGNREAVTEGRETVSSRYESVRRDLQDAEGKLAALPLHRPASVVAEEIARHRQNRRWEATRECSDATQVQSRVYCEQYFSLRAERAAGLEGERLAGVIAALKGEAARLRAGGAGQEGDPQVALVSRISGLGEDKVRLALIVIVALLVETGSSLGLFLASGHGEVFRRRAREGDAGPQALLPAPASPHGRIEDFCLEALVPSEAGGLTVKQVRQAYENWCVRKGATPLERKEFAARFERIVLGIGLAKSRGLYGRIALRENAPA